MDLLETPPEVHNTDSSDEPQSEERSPPPDHRSFEEEEEEDAELERPLPAHPEPTRPPVALTQPYYLSGELLVHLLLSQCQGWLKVKVLKVCDCAPSDARIAGFPPYYKPYAWEPVSSSFELRQMSFSPKVLQHAGNLYSNHLSCSPPAQQPLDCSTHYSPTSNTYHCITCDKVSIKINTCITQQYLTRRCLNKS